MIATLTFNPSIDQNLIVHRLVKDDANRAEAIVRTAGGKGLNVSKVVRELGGRTHAYALVGGYIGEYWKALVSALDIPCSTIAAPGETRVNTILTDKYDGTQTRVSAPGPSVPARCMTHFMRCMLTVKPRPYLWALGGSLAQGMPVGTYRRFIEALQSRGTSCILDADGDALREGLKAKPFMIKPNEFETGRLLRRRLSSLKDYSEAARFLVKKGVKVVVISLAARGAIFATETELFHIPAIDVPIKSKVGAGDSLIGGVALGLMDGRGLRQAAALGIAASNSAVMREAPRLCLKSDMPRLLRRVRFKSL